MATFYDTVKGGDYRAREANVYRLAQVSANIIDQCAAQGVPFARDYGGYLANRSFGGAQVSRTFYARGQTGQQLLLGAYSSLQKEVSKGKIKVHTRCELVDVVTVDGRAEVSSQETSLQVSSQNMQQMLYFYVPVAMVMCTTYQQMQWLLTLQQPGGHIKKVLTSQTHASLKFTQLVSLSMEIINLS